VELGVLVEIESAPRSLRKTKGNGHHRRAEILAAAEQIFLTHGYAGTTIRGIAEAVGVSSTALYMHFPDKSAILYEICKSTVGQVFEGNKQIAIRDVDAGSRVRQMLEAYMAFALEHPNAYLLVFSGKDHQLQGAHREDISRMSQDNYSVFLGAVRTMAASHKLRGNDPDLAAQILWSACHGLVSLLISMPDFEWDQTARLKDTMLDSLLAGILSD